MKHNKAFPNWPLPERFRNYEDAMAFLRKPDWTLCIPAYTWALTEKGIKWFVNPEYENAPFEQQIVWQPVPLTMLIRSGRREPSNTSPDIVTNLGHCGAHL